MEPNDVDCVLLIGPDFPHDAAGGGGTALAGLPFINMELVDPGAFQQFTEQTFAGDVPGCVRAPRPHRPGFFVAMTIENRRQLENTRIKLQDLEQLYVKTQQGPATSERSLKKRINQFKEEIARFEARAGSGTLKG